MGLSYMIYKWAETPYEWHEELFAHARKQGITVFSTPFDETAVDLLENLGTPTIKLLPLSSLTYP